MKTTPFSTFTRRMTTVTLLGIAALAMGMFGSNSASASTTNLVASKDSYIRLEAPFTEDNYGSSVDLATFANGSSTEDRRVLMSFDLSFLTGVTITSATLKLGVPTSDANPPFDGVHSVQRLLRDFVENQVTWSNYSTGNAWTAPGAVGGSDSVNIASGIEAGEDGTPATIQWASGGLNVSSVVSNWFVSPDTTQLGFLVYHRQVDGVALTIFGSRESLNGPGPGPVLEISYIPEPTVVGLIGLGGLLVGFARFRRKA